MEPTFATGSHSRYSCMSGSSENSAVMRRRHPAGLQVRRRVGLGADPHEAVVLPGLEQGGEDGVAVLPGAEQLEAGLAGHAVPQRRGRGGRRW